MRRRAVRQLILPTLLIPLFLAAAPRPAQGQWVVLDPSNLVQAILGNARQTLEYIRQGSEVAEAINTVQNLATQIRQLDDQINHLQDAANGRIAALANTVRGFTSNPASLFADASPTWGGSFVQGSSDLLDALINLDGSSLVDHLQGELDQADVVGEADFLTLYPNDPDRGTGLAERWEASRVSSDRLRTADFAAADAAGRVTELLADAQPKLDRLRDGAPSNTALQQAAVAGQLIDSEVNLAVAQLLALEAQKTAIARQEAELLDRRRLERWLEREQARQDQLIERLSTEAARRTSYRTFLLFPTRHGG